MIWTIRAASAAIILIISANLCFGLSAPAVEYENVIEDNGYHFKYTTLDSEREEKGSVIPGKTPSEGTLLVVVGSYNFVAPDGKFYAVSYVADENGFRIVRPVARTSTGYASSALIASLAGGGLGK